MKQGGETSRFGGFCILEARDVSCREKWGERVSLKTYGIVISYKLNSFWMQKVYEDSKTLQETGEELLEANRCCCTSCGLLGCCHSQPSWWHKTWMTVVWAHTFNCSGGLSFLEWQNPYLKPWFLLHPLRGPDGMALEVMFSFLCKWPPRVLCSDVLVWHPWRWSNLRVHFVDA